MVRLTHAVDARPFSHVGRGLGTRLGWSSDRELYSPNCHIHHFYHYYHSHYILLHQLLDANYIRHARSRYIRTLSVCRLLQLRHNAVAAALQIWRSQFSYQGKHL